MLRLGSNNLGESVVESVLCSAPASQGRARGAGNSVPLGCHLPMPAVSHAVLEQEPSIQHKSASVLGPWLSVQDGLRQEGFRASNLSLHTSPAAVRMKLFLESIGKAF